MGGASGHAAKPCAQILVEEQEEVDQRHHRQQDTDKVQPHQGTDNVQSEQCAGDPGQILDLDRNKPEQDCGFGVQHGEGEEHGHIDIIGACQRKAETGNQRNQNHGNQGKECARKIKDVELGCAPFPLQRAAEEIIEEKGNNQPEGAAHIAVQSGVGDEQEGDQPPDLAVEQAAEIECEEADGAGIVAGEHVKNVNNGRADHDDLHQVRNAEIGMLITKFVNFAVDALQKNTPPKRSAERALWAKPVK